MLKLVLFHRSVCVVILSWYVNSYVYIVTIYIHYDCIHIYIYMYIIGWNCRSVRRIYGQRGKTYIYIYRYKYIDIYIYIYRYIRFRWLTTWPSGSNCLLLKKTELPWPIRSPLHSLVKVAAGITPFVRQRLQGVATALRLRQDMTWSRRKNAVQVVTHDGSMVLPYMVTWIPLIYPLYVSIYTSTMDPVGNVVSHVMISRLMWNCFALSQDLSRVSRVIDYQHGVLQRLCDWTDERHQTNR